jgi:hypothetical protein
VPFFSSMRLAWICKNLIFQFFEFFRILEKWDFLIFQKVKN